ncbi:ABC transporter permease [Flavonifractor sp. An82]|uniref:uracil-xanthine permease family protein n=1 Tax=Flavonifractor sp. An82 TaxID=1965660 RepID=UPI000B3A896B|nr:uracil-xanthine permease family protein [Flavonifractor sp. An82]OUN23240.1 ABC transporter permease [Flavonifractor sp. An82]
MARKIDTSQGIYNAPEQLGWPRTLVLGFQHMFAMFGATVLVPILTGLSISTTLLCAGVGTLLFHLITKGKVPAFLGSSFAFLGGFAVVAPLLEDGSPNKEMLPYACGGIVIAGLLYLVLSGLITVFGIKKVMRLFPPVVTGPIIILIGLILSPSAITNVQSCWWLGVITMAIIVGCAVFGRGMIGIIPILLGVVGGYVIGAITGQVSFTLPDAVVAIPDFTLAKFEIGAILTMAPIALATMMEHVGDISAISATCKKNFIANPGLNRTLLGDGLATSLAGLVGGPANTTYGENTGVLALSKVYDPLVIRIAAILAVIMSFIPFLETIIAAMPSAVIGGASFILYGMISAIGVRNMVENQVDLTKQRNLMIAAIILVSGLGINSIGGLQLGPYVNLSGLACAAIFGIILNAILPGKDFEFDMSDLADQDSSITIMNNEE